MNGITIERCYDRAPLRILVLHPSIFPYVSDDYTSKPEQWQPNFSEQVVNLVAKDREGHFGFGIFIARTHACYEAHMGFLPRSRKGPALQAFKKMLQWMWQESSAARIVGEIERSNRRATLFALMAGFTIYGVNPKSKLKNGTLVDQVCLGISRA